jgi:hypothetical protein
MNAPKALSDDQARLIRELGLDARTVTFKKQRAALPCQITIHTEGRPLRRWLYRDQETGKLKLEDEKPSFTKPRREDKASGGETNGDEPLELEKVKGQIGKWRQTGKQSLSDSIEHCTHNPDEVEARLKEKGFTKLERELVLKHVFDKVSLRQLAAEKGMKKSSVAAKIKQAIEDLLSGNSEAQHAKPAREPEQGEAGQKEILVPPLTNAMNALRNSVKSFQSYGTAALGYATLALEQLKLPDSMNVAEKILVAAFRYWPSLLSNPNIGPGLIAVLEKLLNDALYGSKSAAAKARKTLKSLLKFGQGAPRSYPWVVLTTGGLSKICVSLHALRQVWAATSKERTPARLEIIRQGVGSEERNFSDRELRRLMDGDLLTAAARVAEKATGIKNEVFVRAQDSIQDNSHNAPFLWQVYIRIYILRP